MCSIATHEGKTWCILLFIILLFSSTTLYTITVFSQLCCGPILSSLANIYWSILHASFITSDGIFFLKKQHLVHFFKKIKVNERDGKLLVYSADVYWACEVKSLSRVFVTPWIVQPTRLLHPWNFLGKSTGVVCHFFLQGIFPNPVIEPGSPALQVEALLSEPPGNPFIEHKVSKVAQSCLPCLWPHGL